MADAPSNDKPPLRVGVLLLSTTIQLLDASPADLFSLLQPEYLSIGLPQPLVALGVPVSINYIASSGAGSLASTTAKASIHITAGLTDKIAKPGNLDILLVPGPEPTYQLSGQEIAFVRGHFRRKGAVVMTVCTGVYAAAQAGILERRQATGPRALVPELRKKWPGAKWVEKRWTADLAGGEDRADLWTSAGVTNGQDMVAAYLRSRWPGPLSNTICGIADVGGRSQEYENGTVNENAWWIFQILWAWLKRF